MQETEKLIVELIRRGATLLKEPCPNCGGLMVKYKGKVICPTCSGAKSIKEIEGEMVPKKISTYITEIVRKKVYELSKKLEKTTSINKEKEIVELLILYYKLMNQIKQYQESEKR